MSHEHERTRHRELPRERERIIELSPQDAVMEIGRFGVADSRYYDADLLAELQKLKAVRVANGIAFLTRDGRGAARHLCGDDRSVVVRGPVKDNRIEHDLAVHRECCEARVAIEKDGGRVLDIRTEAEFVRDLGRATGRSGSMRASVDDFARAHDLNVIEGALRVPDCRIVYELDGETRHIDLEIASAHAGSRSVQAKKAAGMHVVDRNSISRSQDRHDGMAELLR